LAASRYAVETLHHETLGFGMIAPLSRIAWLVMNVILDTLRGVQQHGLALHDQSEWIGR
jgi:hypothetical protein